MIRRATVTYDIAKALKAGEPRHPGAVMRLLAWHNSLTILSAEEQVLAQTWIFEVQIEEPEMPPFPAWCETRPHR